MNFLFWNTCKNQVNSFISDITNQLSCDIIALAEYNDDINALIKKLSLSGQNFYPVPQIGCQRINIITRFTPGKVLPIYDTSYYTIKKIPHETLGQLLVAFLHFPSKLYMKEHDFFEEARMLKDDIDEIEKRISNNKTVVVGDFNMNPFEIGMIAASSLHSVPSGIIAKKNSRVIKGRCYSMFYNPMWNLLGDLFQPPGSYFYPSAEHICYFWNIFDQVIIRPSLVDHFDKYSVKLINEIGGKSLLKQNGCPNSDISDHLPLFFKII